MGASNLERVTDMAVDDARSVIYSVGYLSGNPNFSEISNGSLHGGEDGYIFKYDTSGTVLWAFPVGGTSDDRINGVAVDEATGDVYITGYVEGSYASNNTTFYGAAAGAPANVSGAIGNQDAFVAKYNVFGQLLWYRILGSADVDRGMDITVNAAGVFMTGFYTNSVTSILPSIIPTSGVINNFVIALNKSNGSTLWDAVQGSGDDDFDIPTNSSTIRRNGITSDANGIYLVNYFRGINYAIYDGADLLATTIADPNFSDDDFVVTAYSNAGGYNWSALYDNAGSVAYGLDITNDCDGVYVSGSMHDGGVTPGGTVISSVHDNFLLSKLNKSNGTEIWVKNFQSSENHDDYFVGIDADGYGNLYAVGRLRGTSVTLGSELNFTGGQNNSEIMIAHLHTDGNLQNFEVIPGTNTSWGMSVGTYKNERYIVGGYYSGNLTFGSVSPSNGSFDNAFVASRTLAPPIDYNTNTFPFVIFCQDDANPIPALNVPGGGTFSGPPEVVFADNTTGEIDVVNSTPGGSYTITYSGFTNGCAITSYSLDIYILANQDASFAYTTNTFCTTGSNPSPSSITTPGGSFNSLNGGLAIADATTGELDLAGSTPGGPYTLVYTTNGPYCPSSDSLQVYITASLDAGFGYSSSNYCTGTGSTTPTFVLSPGGIFSAPAGITFVDNTTGEIDLNSSLAGGPYTIQYNVGSGICSDSSTFDITIVQSEDASFTFSNVYLCANEPNVSAASIVNPGGSFFAPTGLVITNGSTGEISSSSSTVGGPYQLFYTTNGSTCPGTDSLSIYIEAAPDASFTYPQSVICTDDGIVAPNFIASAGGTFSAPAGLDLNPTTGAIDPNSSTIGTTFPVKYVLSNAYCEDSVTFSITIVQSEAASFNYAASSYCQGDSDPVANIWGTLGGIFSATAGVVFTSTSTGEIDLSASTPGGPYTITYTTPGAACPDTATFDVTINAEEDPTFIYSALQYCQGDPNPTPTLSGTPGGIFSAPAGLLFVNASTGEIDLAGSTAGSTYAITYTTPGANCQNSLTINVTINPEENATFSYSATEYCQGDANPAAIISGTGSGLFTAPTEIVFANTSTGEIDLSASTAGGPFTITFTTQGPCPNSATFNLTINAEEDPTFNYSALQYCQGDANPTPTITGTTGGTFSSTAGLIFVDTLTGEIDLASSTAAGTYAVTYTTPGANCPNSLAISITINPEDDPTFSYSATEYCQGDANPVATISGTGGGLFTAPTGIVFANPSTGEINLSASTPGGPYTIVYSTPGTVCPNTSSFNVTINADDYAAFAYTNSAYCQGDANPTPTFFGTLGGTFSGPAGIVFVNSATGEIDLAASTPGGPYIIQYLTSGVCPDSSTFTLTINAEDDPTFNYSATQFCQGDANPTPTITGTVNGTFTGPAGIIFVDPQTGEINLSASNVGGPFTITYTTPGPNCVNSSTFDITIDEEEDASFSYGATEYCQGDVNPTPAVSGTAGGLFSAPLGIVFVDALTGEIDLAGSQEGGPYLITYSTPGTLCPNTSTFSVIINGEEDPTFDFGSATYCQGGIDPVANVSGTTGGTFSGPSEIVFYGSPSGKINLAQSTVGGPYTITYTTPGGACPNSSTFDVTILGQDDVVSVNYSASDFCVSEGNQVPVINGTQAGVFSGTGSINFVNTSTGEFNPATSTVGGPHLIKYVTSGVCPDSVELFVSIFDELSAYAGEDQKLYFVTTTELQADLPLTGVGSWSAVPDVIIDDVFDPTTSVSNLRTGSTEFVWTVSNGVCPSVSDEVIIEIEELFIPEAVTPNADGKNDFFELHSIDEVTCSLQIFNRWGQMVYENTNYQNEWNGLRLNGRELENDTYFYVIVIDDAITYNGYVVLKK